MILLDTLLRKGLGFVLQQVAVAVDAELNDLDGLREQLLSAQMQLELGDLSDEDFGAIEGVLLARMRELQERQRSEQPRPSEGRISGVSVDTYDDDEG